MKQETLHWDDRAGKSSAMRSKEHADDYRYFPDPDLPPLKLDADWLEKQRAALPELPLARRARYRESYGLPDYDAEVLTDDRDVSEFFEAAVKSYGQPKTVSNWVMRDVLAAATEAGKPLRELPLTPAGARRAAAPGRRGADHGGLGARGVRRDGEDGRARRGDRARARARGGLRRGRARGPRARGDRGERATRSRSTAPARRSS